MLELKLDIDGIDYNSLIKIIMPLLIKNKIAAKTATITIEMMLKTMSEREKNTYAVNFINENKNKITEILNDYAKNKGIRGNICNCEAKII